MKPIAEIMRQLGTVEPSPPGAGPEPSSIPSPPPTPFPPAPPGFLELFKARSRTATLLAHAEWPQRGQVLRIEKRQPAPDERPFAVLLLERTDIPNVWSGYAVGPESELDYSAEGDLVLGEYGKTHDPMAAFIQTWNPVRVPVPCATACLAWLDQEAMRLVLQAAGEYAAGHERQLLTGIQEYRRIYLQAAQQWNAAASALSASQADGQSLFERLAAQLGQLARVAAIGQWRPAVEYPMGQGEKQQLIWRLEDIEIRIDDQTCIARKVGAGEWPVKIQLLLGDLLLESHTLKAGGDTAAIQLIPENSSNGNARLTLQLRGGGMVELRL